LSTSESVTLVLHQGKALDVRSNNIQDYKPVSTKLRPTPGPHYVSSA